MKADITQHPQDAQNSDQHEIRLVWEYGNGEDKAPTLLNLTMVCPHAARPRKADASGKVRQGFFEM